MSLLLSATTGGAVSVSGASTLDDFVSSGLELQPQSAAVSISGASFLDDFTSTGLIQPVIAVSGASFLDSFTSTGLIQPIVSLSGSSFLDNFTSSGLIQPIIAVSGASTLDDFVSAGLEIQPQSASINISGVSFLDDFVSTGLVIQPAIAITGASFLDGFTSTGLIQPTIAVSGASLLDDFTSTGLIQPVIALSGASFLDDFTSTGFIEPQPASATITGGNSYLDGFVSAGLEIQPTQEQGTLGGIPVGNYYYRERHQPLRAQKEAQKQREIVEYDNNPPYLQKNEANLPFALQKAENETRKAKARAVKRAQKRLFDAEQVMLQAKDELDEANMRLIAYLERQEAEIEEEDIIVRMIMELL
jgi:hypothetical protein